MRDSLVHWFETTLDAAAEHAPKPGRVALHRLNRTEYANAVNDLFGLKIDVAALLPKDDESDGFDNIANVLKVSPSFLEQYVCGRGRRERDGGRQSSREDGQPRVLREARYESELLSRGHAARHARRNARRALLPGGRRLRDLARRPRSRALRRRPRVSPQADRRDRRQRGVRERDRRPRGPGGCRPAPGRGRRQDQLAISAHPRASAGRPAHGRGDVRRAHDVGVGRGARAARAGRRGGRDHRRRGEPAQDRAPRDRRPDRSDRRRRYAEPQEDLRLPAVERGRATAVRARDPREGRSHRVPPTGHRCGSKDTARVLRDRQARGRLRQRNPQRADDHSREPGVPVSRRCSARGPRAGHDLRRRRLRARVATLVLPVEPVARRRAA